MLDYGGGNNDVRMPQVFVVNDGLNFDDPNQERLYNRMVLKYVDEIGINVASEAYGAADKGFQISTLVQKLWY
ncbi:MAG: hypothetical protein R3A45_05785 [Bdellovibrionota bacterium]